MGRCIIRVYKKGGRSIRASVTLSAPPRPAPLHPIPPRGILTPPHLEALLDQGGRGKPAQRPRDVALVDIIAAKHDPHNLQAWGVSRHTLIGVMSSIRRSEARGETTHFHTFPQLVCCSGMYPPRKVAANWQIQQAYLATPSPRLTHHHGRTNGACRLRRGRHGADSQPQRARRKAL